MCLAGSQVPRWFWEAVYLGHVQVLGLRAVHVPRVRKAVAAFWELDCGSPIRFSEVGRRDCEVMVYGGRIWTWRKGRVGHRSGAYRWSRKALNSYRAACVLQLWRRVRLRSSFRPVARVSFRHGNVQIAYTHSETTPREETSGLDPKRVSEGADTVALVDTCVEPSRVMSCRV